MTYDNTCKYLAEKYPDQFVRWLLSVELTSCTILNKPEKTGFIDEKSEQRIRELSFTQLEALGEALLDFSTLADLVAWLDREGRLAE